MSSIGGQFPETSGTIQTTIPHSVPLVWRGPDQARGSSVTERTRFDVGFQAERGDSADHPREVIDAALAHVVQNRVEADWRHTDLFERRASAHG